MSKVDKLKLDSSFFEVSLRFLCIKAFIRSENLYIHFVYSILKGGVTIVVEIPKEVNKAIEILNKNGHSAYVVGGAVRNALLGIPVNDWDITTSALPEETLEAFRDFRTIETGLQHGTVTVLIDSMPIEITTYRIEHGYSDNRHPDSVDFTDKVDDDLSRRDFTVNAIAYSPSAGFADPFGGQEDIKNKIIRCVGDADKRFGEDSLRILRAIRFASVLGFDIHPDTAESIMRNYRLLKNISVERIFVEISKMLCGINAEKILNEYSEVIFFVLPELAPMKNCAQNHERHIFDVWGHTVKSVANIDPVPDLRLAMLFHDSGKPHTKSTDENGIDHFYGHGKTSKNIAYEALTRLKTSNKLKEHVCSLVEFHDFIPSKISKKTFKKYIASLGIETVKELFKVREADVTAQNPKFTAESLKENEVGLKTLEEIESEEVCFKISDLEINGSDLLKLGLPKSPEIGRILNILLDEVMDETTPNNKEALIARAIELKDAEREKT